MAESYRGITIKFGGDTSNLQKALSNVTKSARLTETEMRRIDRAMRLDPSNIQAAALKLDLLETRTTQANAKLSILKQTMNDLVKNNEALGSMSMNELIEGARKSRDEYNLLIEALAKVKQEMEDASGMKFDENNVEAYLNSVKELSVEGEQLVQKYEKLRATFKSLDDAKPWQQMEQMVDLRTEIAKTTSEAEKYRQELKRIAAENAGVDRIGETFVKLKNDITQADISADQLEKEMHQLNNALKLDPSNVEAAAMRFENMNNQIEVARAKSEALTNQMKEIQTALGGKTADEIKKIAQNASVAEKNFDNVGKEVQKLKGDLVAAENEARKLKASKGEYSKEFIEADKRVKTLKGELKELLTVFKQVKADFQNAQLAKTFTEAKPAAAELDAYINKLERDLSSATGKLKMSTSSLTTLGLALYSTVTPMVGMAGSKIVESANEIDGAFRDMKKTVEGTQEQFENLKKAAIEYSNTHVTSADQILEIEAMGGQLGIAVENLESFAEVVSNLDIATNMEAQTIAEQLGSLSNIMHMNESDFERFGNALVRLGNNMPTQESKIMDITTRIGSFGSIIGMTTPEILAWSTAIAATGQKAESAGTAISNTMSDIETAVASGGDSLQMFADVAGKSAEEFAKTWKENPSRAMQDFVEGLKRIKDEGGSVDKTLQDLEITGTRQKQALEGLTQTVGVLDDALTMSNNAWDGISDQWGKAGDAAREAAQKSEGFSGALQILKNIAANFASVAGESITEPIKALSDVVLMAAKAFEELPPEMQTFLTLAVGSTAAMGPLLTIFAAANTAFGKIGKSVTKAATAWKAANMGIRTYREAIVHTINPASQYIAKTDVATKSTKKLMIAAKATAAAMSLLKTAAVGAGIAIAVKLIDVIGKYMERQKNLDKATRGISTSLRKMGDGFLAGSKDAAAAIKSMESSYKSFQTVRQEINETIKNQAELSDTISKSMQEVGNKIGIAESYRQSLIDLSQGAAKSAEDVGKLRTTVDMVNDALGLNLQVVKEGDGSYRVYRDGVLQTVDMLNKLIDTTEIAMQVEAQRQSTQELYNQRAETEQAYLAALEKEQEAYERLQNAKDDELHSSQAEKTAYDEAVKARQEAERSLKAIDGQYKAVTDNMNFLNEALSAETDSIKYAVGSNSLFVASMNKAGKSLPSFSENLEKLGITAKQFGDLESKELAQLASEYDGTATSIYNSLHSMGKDWGDYSVVEAEAIEKIRGDLEALGISEEEMANKSAEELQTLVQHYKDLGDAVGLNLEKLKKKLDDYGVSQEQIAALTPEQLQKIKDAYESGSADIQRIFLALHYNIVDMLGKTGEDGGQSFADAMASKQVETMNAGETDANAANEGLGSADTEQTGKNFAQGFIDGIGSLVHEAVTAAADLGTKAWNALQGAIHEGSPSKLTKQSGKFFSQGFALGIKADTQLAVEAAKRMGVESAAALNDSLDTISDMTFAVSTEHGYGAARAGNVYNDSKETINVYIDGAIVNDNEQIGTVLKETLIEYKRKSDM